MDGPNLFCTSQSFTDRIGETARRLYKFIDRPIRLVETIILPDFGQRTILRFDLGDDRELSFEEADQLESDLRILAGPDYWVTLVGSCFRTVLPDLRQRLLAIDGKISADVIRYAPTCYSGHIKKDAQEIRNWLKLSSTQLLWEIEIPALEIMEEPVIRVINSGKSWDVVSKDPKSEQVKIGNVDFTVVYLENDASFAGCVKAYFMAEKQRMALTSYIAQITRLDRGEI